MNVTVVGLGRLGSPLAAVLAQAGNRVIGVDLNHQFVDKINRRESPVDEPELEKLIHDLPDGQLTATTAYKVAIRDTDLACIIVPTPSLPNGVFDASYVVDAVESIGAELQHRSRPTPYSVVICSTVMPGTMADEIVPALERSSGMTVGKDVLLSYNPQFIALGTVISDLMQPDFVLIGAMDDRSAKTVTDLSATFRPYAPIKRMSFVEAEICKIVINGYLSIKIGYANMVGSLARTMGADAHKILQTVGDDTRIGRAYLRTGGIPGGPCLPRDTVAIEAFGRSVDKAVPLISAARAAARNVVQEIEDEAGFRNSPRPKVAILGIAYKPGSPVTDDSLGLLLIGRACMSSLNVRVHDPVAKLPEDFPWASRFCDTVEMALNDVDTVIIACPHVEYENLDFSGKKVVNPWE